MAEPAPNIADAGGRRRAGVCPSLLRIVAARDGGICRVKLPLGHLSATQARAVAAAARDYGSGVVDATNRANLQLRGVRHDSSTELIAALVAAGLGPARQETEDIRNVMVSPMAGIDPSQRIDALPPARALLGRIETDRRYAALSAKFSFLVDGGESVAAVDRPHDVWLAGLGGARMALGFAGSPPVRAGDTTPFVMIDAGRAVDAVAAALSLFLDETESDPAIVRFRDLFARISRARFLDRLTARLGLPTWRSPAIAEWRRAMPRHIGHIGIRAQRQPGLCAIGAAPPLGRLSPEMLDGLAAIAESAGDGHIRLTPWHSIMLPSVPDDDAARTVRALGEIGLSTDPRDPLATMAACSGSAGCSAALAATQPDARALAAALGRFADTPLAIHVGGCAKSCAAAGVPDVNLIACGPGSYQLSSGPADNFGPGAAGSSGSSIPQIAARLRASLGERAMPPAADRAGPHA